MRIRPCIDIHDGSVKQIVGSSIHEGSVVTENFVSDRGAGFYADLYREMDLPGGHVILLNSSVHEPELYEKDRIAACEAFRAYPGGLMAGGGVNPENAGLFLDAGASHVIVTSYVFRDGRLDEQRLGQMVSAAGREKLVLDLSCRRRPDGSYVVVTDRWQKETEFELSTATLTELSGHCSEFLIHAADVEGRRGGIEETVVRILSEYRSSGDALPCTYAGGVRNTQDIERIGKLSGGDVDVTVGSALDLFGGTLSLEQAVRTVRKY